MPRRLAVAITATLSLLVITAALPAQRHSHNNENADDWVSDCDHWSGDAGERFCEVRLSGYKATGAPIVVDGGENGGASVRAWDRDSVQIEARVQTHASTLDDAKKIAQQVKILVDGGRIRADGPAAGHREWWSVSFVVSIPRKSDVNLTANNGPVYVAGVKGTMDLRTVNGPVVLNKAAGNVRARTQNGPLVVTLTGTSWDGQGLDAETSNGPVSLEVPEGYNAHLETGTVNGPFDIGFPITIEGKLGRRLTTDLGKGGATVRALTTNGPVHLDRPGKGDPES